MDVVRIPGGGSRGRDRGGGRGRPREEPIGMVAARVGKALDRGFADALVAAGGDRPTWLVLLAVVSGAGRTQAGIAERVGISGPTLTHHLDRLEASGLVRRTRDPANRRTHTITLTSNGEAMFDRLREAAVAFDRRLRAGRSAAEMAELRRLLVALYENVTTSTKRSATTT